MQLPFRISLIASLLFLSACTDLEPELFEKQTPETFFNSDEEYFSFIGNAYYRLAGMGNHNSLFSLQEVSSDEMILPQRGADWFTGQWIHIHRHDHDYRDEAIGGPWFYCYSGIYDCNYLISQLKAYNKPNAAPYLAELRAIRALYYYWLLDLYGNVPIYTEADDGRGASPKANVDRIAVFAFVEQELLEVIGQLSKEVPPGSNNRMNYYAAQALLSALYLNAEVYTGTAQWQKTITACDAIINSGEFELENDFFDSFKTHNENSSENIFVVPYDKVNLTGFNLAQMTLHYESQKTYLLEQQPWNGYCSLQEFYQSFDENDVRKGSFITGPQYAYDGSRLIDPGAEPQDPDGPPITFTPEVNELYPNCLRQAGARVGKFEFEIGATPDLSNDFPIFRYAEILLNKAEALWRLNPGDGQALALVKQIQQRANAPRFTQLSADSLLAERGRELAFEAKRRTDLIRFGAFTRPWEFKPQSDPCKALFPIPYHALETNPLLKQNPCY